MTTIKDKSVLQMEVFTSPTRQIGEDARRTFSPITSTLIFGAKDAVLVDTQFFKEDVDALGDMIERVGRRLTTIFVTHGHGDHYFGAGRLVERFSQARCIATPDVVAYIKQHRDRDVAVWSGLFGDRIELPTLTPTAMDGDAILLEDHELKTTQVEQGDIAPTAMLHVPDLAAVIAGDVVYNEIHQMMAFSGPNEWREWTKSIESIRSLKPKIVVAGHKKPEARDDEVDRMLDGTQDYIRAFAEAADSAPSVEALVEFMLAKYPNRGNLTTLMVSADAAIKRRTRT